jgi:hypothetical protein
MPELQPYRPTTPQRLRALDPAGSVQWPDEPLQAFLLAMWSHGFPVSGSLMANDLRYALDQLRLAHTLADDDLRWLAMQLFRHFERERSGTAAIDVAYRMLSNP